MVDTSKDVQLAVGEILGSTKHLVRSMDEVKTDIRDIRAEFRAEQASTNERLTKVEQFMWKAVGISISVATTIPIIITAVGWWLKL